MIELSQAPPLVHRGTQTLWPVYCTDLEAQKLRDTLIELGTEVQILSSEPDSPPLTNLARTPSCPSCFFFDPEEEESCGLRSRPKDSLEAALVYHEKAQADRQACSDPPDDLG